MMKRFFKNILFSLCLSISSIGGIISYSVHSNNILHAANATENLDLNQVDSNEQTRTITFTYFNGSAIDIDINDYISSYFNYPRQCKYYRFTSNVRQCVRFNYSGPTASLRIFYSNFFLDSDYLVSIPYINNAIDCYMFDSGCEYIIELSPYSVYSPTAFSFQLTTLTISTLTNHNKYAIHQIMDQSSNVGYHYETVFFDVSNTYTLTNGNINSYSSSTTYANVIDSSNWFFDPTYYYFTDNRRVVVDTGYDEYSSIAYAHGRPIYNSISGNYSTSAIRFSGTFISETVVLSCAHAVFPHTTSSINNQIKNTGMNDNIYFSPGVNDYAGVSYYGTYYVNELYASISYILECYNNNQYTEFCADYDWSICLTSRTVYGSRTHSYMGISGYSYPNDWSFARCAGYPAITSTSTPNIFHKTMWASYPLENTVHMTNGRIKTTNITTSGGNSGCPLYYKYTVIQNGQPTIFIVILGIFSGYAAATTNHSSIFCRNTGYLVNIAKTILGITT